VAVFTTPDHVSVGAWAMPGTVGDVVVTASTPGGNHDQEELR